jgi:hypothetical protein
MRHALLVGRAGKTTEPCDRFEPADQDQIK